MKKRAVTFDEESCQSESDGEGIGEVSFSSGSDIIDNASQQHEDEKADVMEKLDVSECDEEEFDEDDEEKSGEDTTGEEDQTEDKINPGRSNQPRGVRFEPLEVDAAPSAAPSASKSRSKSQSSIMSSTASSTSTTATNALKSEESSSAPVPTRLLSLVREASDKFTKKLPPFAKYGSKSQDLSPTSLRRLRSRSSSVDLTAIASSNDEFNYFTVYEDTDDCLVLTHVNSQRNLMENLFTPQEKKKRERSKKKQLVRRQSTQVSTQTRVEEDFKDLDIYVMHSKTADDVLFDSDHHL